MQKRLHPHLSNGCKRFCNSTAFRRGIRSIQYTGAASGDTKIRSASGEKVDIPGPITTGFPTCGEIHKHNIEKLLNEGLRVLNRI